MHIIPDHRLTRSEMAYALAAAARVHHSTAQRYLTEPDKCRPAIRERLDVARNAIETEITERKAS